MISCMVCGKIVGKKSNRQKYCSSCAIESRQRRLRRKERCTHCGYLFLALIRLDGKKSKFCSRYCWVASTRKYVTCEQCEKRFSMKKSRPMNEGKFCSRTCQYEAMKGKRYSPKTEFKKGELPEGGKKTRFKNGELHPHWKGGVTPIYHRFKQTKAYKKWRNSVYLRDYWTCQICLNKCSRRNIVAHHVKSFADYPDLRLVVSNGLTLCRGCHINVHREAA